MSRSAGRLLQLDEHAVRADGWMNATSAPSAPGRGCSSISFAPRAFSCASAAWMSSTRSVMWWSPGPRLSTYFAIGESGAVASSSSSFDSPDRHEMRAHALRRHLLGRLDLEAERVAIERQRGRQILDRDADVIEDGFHGFGNRVIG